MTCFILAHGFGFNDRFWDPLLPFLKGRILYYPKDPVPSDQEVIGIGHSLGFFQLNQLQVSWKSLICIQGFLNFCGNDERLRKARIRALQNFKTAFLQDSIKTLDMFYQQCGNISVKIQNHHASKNDLDLMFENSVACLAPIHVLATANDPIVTFRLIQDNFSRISNVSIQVFKNIPGHLLGYQNPEIVAQTILKAYEQI